MILLLTPSSYSYCFGLTQNGFITLYTRLLSEAISCTELGKANVRPSTALYVSLAAGGFLGNRQAEVPLFPSPTSYQTVAAIDTVVGSGDVL